MLEIKKLSLPDATLLAPIAHKIFLDTFLPLNNPSDVIDYADRSLTADAFAREIENPKYFTYGVYWEHELVGYLQMLFNSQETYEGISFELKRFYLQSHYHGRGLAQEMMKFCENVARDQGQSAFWLGVWEKNFKALRFYEKCGFRKIASHPFVMGQETQTDFIYAKYLDSLE